MPFKVDLINGCYSQLRISGLTVSPTPEDMSLALIRLENMMAELEAHRNICIGYNFEGTPNENSEIGVDRAHHHMIETNLALRTAPDFNKAISPALIATAGQAMSGVSGFVASRDIRDVQASSRMPRGSGHRYRERYQRYNRPPQLPRNDCATNRATVGETNDYTEPFHSYLRGETIASFTTELTSGLSLVSSSNTPDSVLYRITFVTPGNQAISQRITITITTNAGRIEIRIIDFELSGTL